MNAEKQAQRNKEIRQYAKAHPKQSHEKMAERFGIKVRRLNQILQDGKVESLSD